MSHPDFTPSAVTRLLASSVAALLAATCSSGPAAPSSAGTSTTGAVIEGTVTGGQASVIASVQKDGASPSAISPMAASLAGLTVRVVGTERASLVGDSGTFRIEN